MIWWPGAGYEIRDHALAEWPTWLLPAMMDPPRPPPPVYPRPARCTGDPDPKLRGIIRRIERASKGERNALVFWGACRAGEMLRSGELPPDINEGWLSELLISSAAIAGLPATEARKTISSGIRRG